MKIKKMCLAISLAVCSVSAFAQGQEVKSVEFNPHSYLQLQGGVGLTLGEAEFTDLLSPAAAFSFGYQFSPVWGARIGVSGWESRGGWVNPSADYAFNYLAGNLDVTLNLSNLFCRYNPERIFNLSMFVGGGVNYAFNNDDAEAIARQLRQDVFAMPYLWHDFRVQAVGRAGLMADFRLSERFSLNLEANANITSDRYNSKKAGNPDWYFNALAGISFRLGKPTRTVSAPVLPVPVEAAPAEKSVAVRNEPVAKPVETATQNVVEVQKAVEEYRCDIFFAVNSSAVSSAEVAKVEALAEFLQKNPEAKVTVTGYADVQTGNAGINLRLSQERADKVAQMLVAKGINASRITAAHKGDTEQPFGENVKNRVCICLAK